MSELKNIVDAVTIADAIILLKNLISTPSFSKEENKTADILEQFLQDRNIKSNRYLNNVWATNKYFDPAKITVENDALGGTSSRTYFENANLFPRVLGKLQPGDYVIMQFGHNDNTRPPESDTLRYRSTISGNGEETVEGPKSATEKETIHTYGWYIRQMIDETKAKGATPIVCSLIPRNGWRDGKINRADQSYGLWAKQAADQEHAAFLPLNTLIADKYDQAGQEKVTATYFPAKETTHTNWAGAKLNAECVVEGIKQLDLPLKNDLLPTPPEIKDPGK